MKPALFSVLCEIKEKTGEIMFEIFFFKIIVRSYNPIVYRQSDINGVLFNPIGLS